MVLFSYYFNYFICFINALYTCTTRLQFFSHNMFQIDPRCKRSPKPYLNIFAASHFSFFSTCSPSLTAHLSSPRISSLASRSSDKSLPPVPLVVSYCIHFLRFPRRVRQLPCSHPPVRASSSSSTTITSSPMDKSLYQPSLALCIGLVCKCSGIICPPSYLSISTYSTICTFLLLFFCFWSSAKRYFFIFFFSVFCP